MSGTVPGATTAGLTWYGHATVRLDLGATTLLTDPVLRARLAHLRRHAAAPPVPDDIDAVLVSHAHHDHLDLPSLRRLAGTPTVVVPRGVARALRRVPMPDVVEIDPGETHVVGDVTVHAVEAAHDGRRAAPRTHPAEALGFVIEGAGLRIYFAGDTERFDGMGVVRGPVDVALLPVWGWGPTLGRGHMDPRQAAQATAQIAPRIVVPIHWGTFLPVGLRRRHGHLLRDPARDFGRHAAELAPQTEVRILAPGDGFAVER